MRTRPHVDRWILRACLSLAAVHAAPAQPRPSFAGQWTLVVDSAAARPATAATGDAAFRTGDMGSGWGSPLTMAQSADSLVVTIVHFSTYDLQPRLRYHFALNGTETVNRVTIGHAESVQSSRVQWDGASLLITTLYPTPPEVGSAPTEVRQRLTIDPGGRLVIETTRPGARGPDVVRTTYTKR